MAGAGSRRRGGSVLRRANGRVEDGRGSLEPIGKHPVSHPRSSNAACQFPALRSPTGFTVRHTAGPQSARDIDEVRRGLRRLVHGKTVAYLVRALCAVEQGSV
jgi:hypothetical protein